MNHKVWLFPLGLAALLGSATTIWANSIASVTTDNLLAMETMTGQLVQKRILPDTPNVDVVQKVLYQKPWKIRAETIAPASLRGSLFLYDGDRVILWWPHELFGIRAINVANPDRDQVYRHVTREVEVALHDYAFSLNRTEKVAGKATNVWKVVPMTGDDYHHPHTMWMHEKYSYPLKVEIQDKDQKLWYGMAYQKIDFNVPLPDKPFDFEFPPNALVMDWDFADPGISLDEARQTMNFTVFEPTALPKWLKVEKLIKARGTLPMLAMVMDNGATRVSLYQAHSFGPTPLMHYGKQITIGADKGYMSFIGTFTTIHWVKGKTALTLMGNLSYPQLIALARSVK